VLVRRANNLPSTSSAGTSTQRIRCRALDDLPLRLDGPQSRPRCPLYGRGGIHGQVAKYSTLHPCCGSTNGSERGEDPAMSGSYGAAFVARARTAPSRRIDRATFYELRRQRPRQLRRSDPDARTKFDYQAFAIALHGRSRARHCHRPQPDLGGPQGRIRRWLTSGGANQRAGVQLRPTAAGSAGQPVPPRCPHVILRVTACLPHLQA